ELNAFALPVLYRCGQVNKPIRTFSQRLAVWRIYGNPIDEDRPQIAVFCRALWRDIRTPAGWQIGFEYGVRHVQIELKARLDALFNRRFGLNHLRQARQKISGEDAPNNISADFVNSQRSSLAGRCVRNPAE